MTTTKLDEFHDSEDFVRMCCERWRAFKRRRTPEQESTLAAGSAEQVAGLIESRRGRARRGEAQRGLARQGNDVPHGMQSLIEGIEMR